MYPDEEIEVDRDDKETETFSTVARPKEGECPECRGSMQDCGIEAADEYRPKRQWFVCRTCGHRENIVLGPPAPRDESLYSSSYKGTKGPKARKSNLR